MIDNETNIWKVETIDNTTLNVDISNAVIEGNPAEGLNIKITGTSDDGINIIADKVVVTDSEEITDDGEENIDTAVEDQEFEGIVQSINGKKWTVQIDNSLKTVNVIQADVSGDPVEVGAEITIKGTIQGDTIKASTIVVTAAS